MNNYLAALERRCCLFCIKPTQVELYSDITLKQKSTARKVALLGQITLIPNQESSLSS